MTPPIFELSLSDKSSPESIHNYNILSERFSELEHVGETLLVKNPDHESYTKFCNANEEDLYIYPGLEEWFLNKEQDLNESNFNLFGAVNLIPIVNDEGNLRVLIPYNNFENMRVIPLFEKKGPNHLNYYYYGEILSKMSEDRGDYYENKENYILVREFLETMTGLKIKDFFIGLYKGRNSLEAGEVRKGELQLAMELE